MLETIHTFWNSLFTLPIDQLNLTIMGMMFGGATLLGVLFVAFEEA